MIYTVKERKTCRICGSKRLALFLELPDVPLTDNLLKKEEIGTEFSYPLKVYFCEDCGLTQTLHDLNASGYYRDYQYSPAVSPFARQFMQRLASEVWKRYRLETGSAVVEIGSSDGGQLACFKALGARVFGFEPSAPLTAAALKQDIPTAQCLFDGKTYKKIPAELIPAQVVLSTYTFDHVPQPMDFLKNVKKIIDPERGLLVIEVHDLDKIFERREFCLFEHEHTTYYPIAVLQRVLARAGFTLICADLLSDNERRGNSLLVVATLKGSAFASQELAVIPVGKYGKADTYIAFGNAVKQSITSLKQYIIEKRRKGVRLAGYGAAGRGIITLALTAHEGDIAYLCDKNYVLSGYYTPISHILVDSPGRLLKEPVDELIVFSFGYFKEIYDELASFREKGGRLVSLLDLL